MQLERHFVLSSVINEYQVQIRLNRCVFLPEIAYSLFVFVFLFFLIVIDLEVSELIGVLRGSNHAKPVPQVILLQVLLGQILKVTFAEWASRGRHNETEKNDTFEFNQDIFTIFFTVWKLQDFSDTQILREIGEFWSLKIVHFSIFSRSAY